LPTGPDSRVRRAGQESGAALQAFQLHTRIGKPLYSIRAASAELG